MINPAMRWGLAIATLAWASAVSAAPLNGSIAIGSAGILPDPGSLGALTSFAAPVGAFYGVSSGSFNDLTSSNTTFGNLVFSSPIVIPSGTGSTSSSMAITGIGAGAGFGTFTAASVQVVNREIGFLDLYFLGSYTPGFGGYDPSEAASLRVGLNRTGTNTGGYSVSFSGTLAAPPAALTPPSTEIPEPISMALLGTGLLGIGLTRRRKHIA